MAPGWRNSPHSAPSYAKLIDVSRRTVDVRIREAGPGDAAVFTELGARTFRDTYAADTDPDDLDAFVESTFRVELQAAELRDPLNLHLLAEVDGSPVGFAVVREEAPPLELPGARPLLLSYIYVDRPFLGSGIGAALMSRCVEGAREQGRDVLWLGVWERNERAIAFYERWGFAHVGEMPFSFGSETHRDLIYALPL